MKRALLSLVLLAMLQPVPFPAFGQDGPTFPAGEKLIVGVVNDPPYLIKGKNGEWTGFSVDIWKAVDNELMVPYEFKEMKFSDLLDSLKNNRIDLAIDGFFLLAEREKYMDFTVPIGSTRLAVATLPDKMDHPWVAAVKIFFSWGIIKIFVLLFMALCLLGFLLWFIERVHNPEHFGGGFIKGIGSGIYWVGSTLASGVCFGISLKSLTARILGLVWMLACAVTLSALTASLTTSLTLSKNMTNTVSEETLRHMRMGGIEGSVEATVLEKMNGMPHTLYKTEEDAMKAVLNKETDGYLYDEITLRYYNDHDYRGKIAVYPTNMKRFSFAYGLPKDSPWRTKINIALMNLMERPDWVFLLKRYGIGQNFEEIPYAPFGRNSGMLMN
ncbi:MAG: transporter substrate-binding domain-containing protein [Deltaproteobacteria bacterium]|nr:transporter substrate-binding domain-containing protein [Deltaproteobacteria bacterium]